MSERSGGSEALRRAGRRAAVGRVAGSGLIAVLCAGALAPLATADPGQMGAAVAGLVGSVGGNVLTDVLTGSIARLRGEHAHDALLSEEAVERALADALETALTSGGAAGAAVSALAKGLLSESGAVLAVLEGVASADPAAVTRVAEELGQLGDRILQSSAIAEGLRAAVESLEHEVAKVAVERRIAAAREHERALLLENILDAVRTSGAAADPDAAPVARCPYRGLAPFEREDALLFSGRGRMTRRLVREVNARMRSGGLLLVMGASGAGKSSLLNAGLFPTLSGTGPVARGVRGRPVRVFTPTAHPLRELAANLADLCGLSAGEVATTLELDPGRAADFASRAARRHSRSGERVAVPVLVIDQCEELFTSVSGADGRAERDAFAQALEALTAAPAPGARNAAAVVVAAVRTDYQPRLIELAVMADAADSAFVVTPMTRAELREAVRAPANIVGVPIELGLVDAVVDDAYGPSAGPPPGAGVLPLVSQAMAATWQLRRGTTLTLSAYRRAGSLSDAVNRSADRAYEALDDQGRAAVRTMFLLLTRVTAEGQAVRRTATRAELYAAGRLSRRTGDAVVEAFAGERLLVLDGENVEICHDVLLDAWQQLRDWLEGDALARARYGELLAAADTWRDATRHRNDRLYRPPQLEAIAEVEQRWRADAARFPLPAHARVFLESSQHAVRHRRHTIVAVIVVLGMLAATTSVAAAIARKDARDAQTQQAIALSRQLAAESLNLDPQNLVGARQLAAAAWAVAPTDQASDAMTSLLTEQQRGSILIGHTGPVRAVAFDPSGTLLASAADDGTVRLWNPATGQEVGHPILASAGDKATKHADGKGNGTEAIAETAAVTAVAFNPSGTLLATGDDNGIVKLWNPATEREVGSPITPIGGDGVSDGVSTVAFNPSGTLLATVGGGNTVQLWNPATEQEIGNPIGSDEVDAIAFNRSGTLLATGNGDGTVQLWNPATGIEADKPITANPGHVGVVGVTFNAAGTLLATTNDGDGTVRLWDPVSGRAIGHQFTANMNGVDHGVLALVFDPVGTLLATAGGDGTVRLWNPTTGQEVGTPITVDAGDLLPLEVSAMAFNPAGTLLATAGADGTVSLWSPATNAAAGAPDVAVPRSTQLEVSGVAYSPSGTILASAYEDGSVDLWNPDTGQRIVTPISAAQSSGFFAVAFDPSGTLLATVGRGEVMLRDLTTGREVGPAITRGILGIPGVAFNPAGTLLATADGDGTVMLWNPVSDREVGKPIAVDASGADGGVSAVAFSPSGTMLATADGDGTVKLWNPETERKLGEPSAQGATAPGSGVSDVAFNRTGTLLAASYPDGTVRLWNPATEQEVGQPIAADPNGVSVVAFNPSGTMLATADGDGTVKLWNPETGHEVGEPVSTRSVAGTPANVEGLSFDPSGTFLATAGADGTVQRWLVSSIAAPYETLCAEAGAPSPATWQQYAANVAEPAVCTPGSGG